MLRDCSNKSGQSGQLAQRAKMRVNWKAEELQAVGMKWQAMNCGAKESLDHYGSLKNVSGVPLRWTMKSQGGRRPS